MKLTSCKGVWWVELTSCDGVWWVELTSCDGGKCEEVDIGQLVWNVKRGIHQQIQNFVRGLATTEHVENGFHQWDDV